jgi:hypothetical protein
LPRVTTYGGRKVATEALPGVRKTAAETPGSTGVGLAEAETGAALKKGQAAGQRAEALAGLGGTVAKVGSHLLEIQAQERERADDVALREAKNYLKRWEIDRLYNPEKGALTQKGKAALPLPEQIDTEFTELTGEIEKGLNPRQLAKWQAIKGDAGVNIHAEIQRHVFGQMQAFETDELEAGIKNSVNLATLNANDLRRASVELSDVLEDLTKSAPRLGIGPEALADKVKAIQSATHVSIIDRLLSEGKTAQAQTYFTDAKAAGQIAGDKLDDLGRALKIGNVRGQAQDAVAAILAAGGTPAAQRAKADAIEDREVRDEARQRLEHEHAILKNEQGQATEDLLNDVYTKLHQSGGAYRLTPTEEVSLGTHVAAFDSYKKGLLKGDPRETDPATYYALLQQATEDPASFAAKGNSLLTFANRLDETDLKRLMAIQMDIRSAKPSAPLAGFLTHKQILDNTLAQYNIPTEESKQSAAQKSAVAQLQRMLDRRVEAAQSKGQKVTNVEIQQTLDDLLSQGETVPGSWWNIWPGGKSVSDTTKRLIDLTPADIPADVRQRIETKLRARNRPVSDATVLDVYLEMQVK